MKNKFTKLTLTLLLALTIPAGFAFAWYNDPIQIQVDNSDITNSLNNINNSIQASTKAFQDAQAQQKIDALNQDCVQKVTADINTNELYIKDTDKAISDVQTRYRTTKDMSDPANVNDMNFELNYLYTLRKRQVDSYKQLTINSCKIYSAPTTTVSCPTNSTYSSTDSKCHCSGGYTNNSENTACVPKTNDQVCRGTFGNASVWDGKFTNGGGPTCGCIKDFEWNTGQTSCVATSVWMDNVCKNSFGPKSISGVINTDGSSKCGCQTGYVLNEQSQSCVVTPTVSIKTSEQTSSTLTIVSSTQPSSGTVTQNSSNIFTTIALRAGSQSVTLNGIGVELDGTATNDAFSSIELTDSSGVIVGSTKTIDKNHRAVIGGEYLIPAGSTVTLNIVGNIASDLSSQDGKVAVLGVVLVNSSAALTGTLPVFGAKKTLHVFVPTTNATSVSNTPSQKQEVKVIPEETVAKHQAATVTESNSTIENKSINGKDTKATTTLPYQKGVIQKFWEWSTGWFHF